MNISESNRAVVLLSGGLDSAVALACANAQGFTSFALTFDYHQRHRSELFAAARVAQSLGVPAERQQVLKIDLPAIAPSALTSLSIEVPKDRPLDQHAEIPSTYVPARNLIFLSCAVALAESVHASAIYLGVNAVDYSGYPDCREEFIKAFATAANLGTKAGTADDHPVTIHTPLVKLSKPEIIRKGLELGVDFSLTQSCYDPVPSANEFLACGHCDSCLIRAKGFADAGVKDPTRYA